MEYRKIKKEEFADLRRIHSLVYFMKYDEKTTDSYPGADENRWEYGRAAFDDNGKMAAVLEAIPFDAYLDGHIVSSPGIAGVATLVENRRAGHVRNLFKLIFNEMHENGDVMSYLYPFSHPYYRMYGYSQGSESIEITTDIANIIKSNHDGYTKQHFPGDSFKDLKMIYDNFSKNYNCCIARQDWRWNRLFSSDPYKTDVRTLIRYSLDGTPVAYVKFKTKEIAEYTYDMFITETVWSGNDGIMGMVSLINGFLLDLKKVRIELPAGFPISHMTKEVWEQDSIIHHTGMNKIIDAQKALKLIKKPVKAGKVIVSLKDEYCPWNTGNWWVEWNNNESVVSKTDDDPDVVCDAPEFSQMITGRYNIEELKAFNKVKILKNEETLSELFVRKSCFIIDRF